MRVASISCLSRTARSTSGMLWPGGDAHHEVQPGQRGLGDAGRVVDARALEGGPQDRLHLEPHRRVVAVARDVHQARHEPAELVLAQEELGLAALLQVQHRGGVVVQLVLVGLEQLVARVGLEDLEEVLAGVRVGREAGAVEDRVDLVGQHGDPQHRLGVGRRREQAEEAPLPRDLAGLVERLDADVVEVGRAVDRGSTVGLGDDEQLALAGHPAGPLAQPHPLARRVIAQQPEAGALHRREHVGPRVVAQLVLAVAEEGEVVVGQPGEQPTGLLDLLGGDADGRGLVEDLRDLGALGTHLGPVLNDLAHVGEHAAQVGRDLLAVGGVAVAVDLEVHPGLAQDPELGGRAAPVDAARVCGPPVEDLLELAGRVAAHEHQRVHNDVDGAAHAHQLGGDRVHEEGHVVGDDLDNGVPAGPALLLELGVEHLDLGGADRAGLRELPVGQGGPEEILGGAGEQVLGGHVSVVPPEEALEPFTPHVVGQLGGGVQQLLTRLLQRHGHACGLHPHPV